MDKHQSMIRALIELNKAVLVVSLEWEKFNTNTNGNLDDIGATDYPFEKSFDELTHDVRTWVSAFIDDIKAMEE